MRLVLRSISQTVSPIAGLSALMRHCHHGDHVVLHAIHQRVGKVFQRPGPSIREAGPADLRHELQEVQCSFGGTFKLLGHRRTAISQVPLRSVQQLVSRYEPQAQLHDLSSCASINACMSASTVSAGIDSVNPASMSATRRAISASHAGCSGGGGTTVSIKRSINSARSSAESCNAAASTDSNDAFTFTMNSGEVTSFQFSVCLDATP